MSVRWTTAFLDLPFAAAEQGVAFWTAVTGYRLSPWRGAWDEFATLLPPVGDAFLRVQRLESSLPGCHLDLHVDELEARTDAARRLGAEVIGREPGLVVLRSPGRFLFCLAAAGDERARPGPTGPAGGRALVDQLTLDIPTDAFERECDLFARLTGWELLTGSRPEFAALVRPSGIPLRLLLQRLDEATGRVRAHLDWACDDVAGETARHRAQGAQIVRATPDWTTLRDPAGLVYCLTRRDPDTGRLP